LYLRKRLPEDPIAKFLMHNDEPPRSSKEITHFSESDLVASEDENVQDDVLSQYALDERVVVFLGIGEVGDVLALA
jgi:NAD(P)H-hydrate repair Nnr-like enzyme with NAD(P)H-hydrate epimerase domain